MLKTKNFVPSGCAFSHLAKCNKDNPNPIIRNESTAKSPTIGFLRSFSSGETNTSNLSTQVQYSSNNQKLKLKKRWWSSYMNREEKRLYMGNMSISLSLFTRDRLQQRSLVHIQLSDQWANYRSRIHHQSSDSSIQICSWWWCGVLDLDLDLVLGFYSCWSGAVVCMSCF